jgi:hypothetical protein
MRSLPGLVHTLVALGPTDAVGAAPLLCDVSATAMIEDNLGCVQPVLDAALHDFPCLKKRTPIADTTTIAEDRR